MTASPATAVTPTGCPYAADVPRVGFDSHDPALARDPFAALDRLREDCPVAWSTAWDGFWVVTGHADVGAITRDRRFHTGYEQRDGSFQGISIPAIGQTGRLVPLELNVPESLRYRRLLAAYYTPNRVAARMAEFRQLADECLDEVVEQGRCDLVRALTERMAAMLTLRDIGLPEQQWAQVDAVLEQALLNGPSDPDAARRAAQELCLMIVDAMEEHRDTGAGSGLIAVLLDTVLDGQPVPDEAIVSMMYTLLIGIHPTSCLVSTSLWHLARDPALRRRLAADPDLVHRSADEFLRWVTPIPSTVRTVAQDVRLGGHDLRAGDRVYVSWAGANRDDSVFPDAARVDVDRDAGAHLSFGGGPHYCVGAGAVRAMFTAMVAAVLARMPDFELADPGAVTWFPDVSFCYGVTSLPVVYTPTPRARTGGGRPWTS
ncbi:cytochrome P450 [Catellatospora sp. KI3]|uniref:cytochrome P450 n=1 Tax=Catellatospora sp. KI3 TaxID=3041620 RepID=UPI0024829421|nr:cytochrome P450 [Catellatospora sp. KI3]MDI1460731.1 cytochrome P450 [Catellatospora sp. KI3]